MSGREVRRRKRDLLLFQDRSAGVQALFRGGGDDARSELANELIEAPAVSSVSELGLQGAEQAGIFFCAVDKGRPRRKSASRKSVRACSSPALFPRRTKARSPNPWIETFMRSRPASKA